MIRDPIQVDCRRCNGNVYVKVKISEVDARFASAGDGIQEGDLGLGDGKRE